MNDLSGIAALNTAAYIQKGLYQDIEQKATGKRESAIDKENVCGYGKRFMT
jgi:hypothetical protein